MTIDKEWSLQHDLLNTLKDVADGHYSPRAAFEMICKDFGHIPLEQFGQKGAQEERESMEWYAMARLPPWMRF